MDTRMVDTEMWINEIQSMLDEGCEVPLNVTGGSMMPFLHHGRDKVLLKKADSDVQTGDIVLYKRANGQFVLHRVVECKNDLLWLAGDAQKAVEGPVKNECVIAKVTKVMRNGKWIDNRNPQWIFFEKIWIKTVPFRDKLLEIRKIIK